MTRRSARIAGVLAVLAIVACAIAFTSIVRHGISTHEEPSRVEVAIGRSLRHWATPSQLRDATNPLPVTAEVRRNGREHFADHCAGCHGNDGKGAGIGLRMSPRAPDMTLGATQQLSDGELFAIIEGGVRLTGMPSFGNGSAESAKDSWALVHFMRELPKLTPADIASMKKLNPRSPAEWQQLQEEAAFLGEK